MSSGRRRRQPTVVVLDSHGEEVEEQPAKKNEKTAKCQRQQVAVLGVWHACCAKQGWGSCLPSFCDGLVFAAKRCLAVVVPAGRAWVRQGPAAAAAVAGGKPALGATAPQPAAAAAASGWGQAGTQAGHRSAAGLCYGKAQGGAGWVHGAVVQKAAPGCCTVRVLPCWQEQAL